MSESRGFPAELLSFLAFGVLGVAVTAAALAGFAQLMAGQGCSGGVVPILATTAVCMGSLLCALAAAFRKKVRGLLTGLLQSTFLAVPLALSAVWNGTAAEPAVVCRILVVLLCGCIGGLLGALPGCRALLMAIALRAPVQFPVQSAEQALLSAPAD